MAKVWYVWWLRRLAASVLGVPWASWKCLTSGLCCLKASLPVWLLCLVALVPDGFNAWWFRGLGVTCDSRDFFGFGDSLPGGAGASVSGGLSCN